MMARNQELERDPCGTLDERWEIADGVDGLELVEVLNRKRQPSLVG